jgi:hypothetical protein
MNQKTYLLFALIVLFTGCQIPEQKKFQQKNRVMSSNASVNPTLFYDTTGLQKAPIKILSATISSSKLVDTVDQPEDNLNHKGHFGRYIMVKIKYKNVSSKRIVGALLRWLIIDKKGKPAIIDTIKNGWEMGYMGTLAPYGNMFGKFSLGIHKTLKDEWEYASSTGQKIKIAFPAEVEFLRWV